jgi:hypothetical protein
VAGYIPGGGREEEVGRRAEKGYIQQTMLVSARRVAAQRTPPWRCCLVGPLRPCGPWSTTTCAPTPPSVVPACMLTGLSCSLQAPAPCCCPVPAPSSTICNHTITAHAPSPHLHTGRHCPTAALGHHCRPPSLLAQIPAASGSGTPQRTDNPAPHPKHSASRSLHLAKGPGGVGQAARVKGVHVAAHQLRQLVDERLGSAVQL